MYLGYTHECRFGLRLHFLLASGGPAEPLYAAGGTHFLRGTPHRLFMFSVPLTGKGREPPIPPTPSFGSVSGCNLQSTVH